mmetsp:Transcript_5640/g.18122  ORF Transcript_5640/g.18122 Transcript_5640/m.18122 type:complete len:87 (-) Transcript_5640:713-973(-)
MSRHDMPLLHASVSEALRLRPPLIFLMRTAMTDLQIKDVVIPRTDTIFLSPVYSGLREEIFSKPTEAYDPYRFLAPRNEHEKHTHG